VENININYPVDICFGGGGGGATDTLLATCNSTSIVHFPTGIKKAHFWE